MAIDAIREKLQREQEGQEAKAMLIGKLLKELNSDKPIIFNDGHIKAKKRAFAQQTSKRKRAYK